MKNTKLTAEQVRSKYAGKYVKIIETYDYTEKKSYYEVVKTYKTIHEDTTLGEDVGTDMEYRR